MSAGVDWPWTHEPDEDSGRHHGYVWLMWRNPEMGTWCGYVVIPEGHPWHGLDDHSLEDVRVHGGITFVGEDPRDPPRWLMGFDTGHAMDTSPLMVEQMLKSGKSPEDIESIFPGGQYRDHSYVRDECRQLCEQVNQAGVGTAPTLVRAIDPLDRTDEELRTELRKMRGEPESAPPKPVQPVPPEFVRALGETDEEFRARIKAAIGAQATRLSLDAAEGRHLDEIAAFVGLYRREPTKEEFLDFPDETPLPTKSEKAKHKVWTTLGPSGLVRRGRRHIIDDPETKDPR